MSLMLLAVMANRPPPLPALALPRACALAEGRVQALVFEGAEPAGREGLARALIAHQSGLEALQPGRALLPAMFGARFPDAAAVKGFLAANETRLCELLAQYGQKREYRVTILCTGAQQPALQARLGAEDEIRLRFRAMLEAIACESLEMPVEGPDMLLNLVVLIEAGAEATLDTALAAIDALATDLLRIRCAGPLPACSFASLASEAPGTEEITAARLALGLPAPEIRVQEPEIRRAFALSARAHHPDAGGEATRFSALRQSFGLLRALAGQDAMPAGAPPARLLRVVRADRLRGE